MKLGEALRELGAALHDLGRTLRAMYGFCGVQLAPEMDGIGLNGEWHPIDGVCAWVEPAASPELYTSGGRIIVGGLLAGPVGAVAGSLHQKQVSGTGAFFIVQGPGFHWIVQFDSRSELRAREFAAQINALSGCL